MTGPEPPDIPRPTVDELIALNHTAEVFSSDTGNALRLVEQLGDRLRYEPELRRWYVWSETHWEPDVNDRSYALTHTVIQRMRDEALSLSDEPLDGGGPSPRATLLRHALRSESEGARRRMLGVAATDPRVIVHGEELDVTHNLLACPNGSVDLDTGELVPTRPEHHNTACVRVPYDPKAESSELDGYLATFVPDVEDQAVLFGVLGASVRGGNANRMLPLLLGPSTSGKSTLLAALANLLRGYAVSVNASLFRGTLDDRPRPDLVRAMHTRLAYASEAAQSWELHADQVKRLTGGDRIAYRDLYARLVEAQPRFTPMIVANEVPRIKGADDALRRRLVVVRFDHSLPTGRDDPTVRERFVSDPDCLAALLVRVVAGARSPAFVNGIRRDLLPERCALATADAFDEVDHVGAFLRWLEECGHLDVAPADAPASHCAKASDLHAWYGLWVQRHGDRADRDSRLNLRDFGRALRSRGWESTTAMGTRWMGRRLLSDPDWPI